MKYGSDRESIATLLQNEVGGEISGESVQSE